MKASASQYNRLLVHTMVELLGVPLLVDEDEATADVFDAATGRPLSMEALGCGGPQLAQAFTTSSGSSGTPLFLQASWFGHIDLSMTEHVGLA